MKPFIPITITDPDVAAQWDYERNEGKRPEEFSRGMVKKVWWICDKGHSYQARVDHRCSMHSECSYCAGKKAWPGFNDLKTLYPEYAAEWDHEKNTKCLDDVVSRSDKDAYWICPICNRSYKRKVNERVLKGLGCKYCFGEKHTSQQEQAFYYYFSLKTDAESRARIDNTEIDIYLPLIKTGIEYNGEYFHENKTDKDKKKTEKLKEKNIRCITVSHGRERIISNDDIILETKHNQNPSDDELRWGLLQAFRLTGIDPPDIDLKRDRTKIYSLYIKLNKNDNLLTRFPELAAQMDPEKNNGLRPEAFKYASNKTVVWTCPVCLSDYPMRIANRTFNNSGCPYCAGKKIKVGLNDLGTTHPALVKEWDYDRNDKTPQEYTKGSDKKVFWRCSKCGHSWAAAIFSRSQGVGCPACAGKVIVTE